MPLGIDIEPENIGWERWVYGVIAPLPIIWFGLLWITTRRADLQGKRRIILHGTDAVAMGLTALCLALALHFHFFWGSSERPILRRYWVAGKALSMLGLLVGLVYLLWCLVRLFIL